MKEMFVSSSINYLKNNNACNEKQEKIFKYTLESLYSFITKSLVILLISVLLKTFHITLLTLLLYSVLRGFSFGIHASKNIYCWIISLLFYIVFPFIISKFQIPLNIVYISFFIGIVSLILWSPSDTKARPLINKNKRIVNKLISIFISSLFIIVSFLLNNENFKEIVSIILLLNSICICPITYYIFKQPYKNYRFYNG